MSQQPETRPYGFWDSPMEPKSLFGKASSPSYPFERGNMLYALRSLPEEGGRNALHALVDGVWECITPEPFNIRTKVHEYGGKCFVVVDDYVYFNNFSDGSIYRQMLHPGSPLECIFESTDTDYLGFADLVVVLDGNYLLAVSESARDTQNLNTVVVIPAHPQSQNVLKVIAQGSDFYAAVCTNPSQDKAAWISWNQPNMPWDHSTLSSAEFSVDTQKGIVASVREIFSTDNNSVCQPGFTEDGELVFCSEHGNGFWNFFVDSPEGPVELTRLSQEFGEAHWVFGQTRWRSIGRKHIIAVATDAEGDALFSLDWTSGQTELQQICGRYPNLAHLESSSHYGVLFVAAHGDREASVARLEIDGFRMEELWAPSQHGGDCSIPEAIEFETRDGATAHAFYYRPENSAFRSPPDSLPPLMVFVHGGPTARATSEFHPLKQYFVSLGFSVLDVNHRGSTGYGREYRQFLLGRWGEVDVTDVIDGISWVLDHNHADRNKVFIRGGSAGGYAVLSALTSYPEVFFAGACYYGIGNLITLSEITHKFEGKYTDQLVGEVFDADRARVSGSRYQTRSPIFRMDQIQSPVILFQGLQDKIVPPEVSREVVSALQTRGVTHEYHEYENEGHGFRNAEVKIDSLTREVVFFRSLLEQTI
ncbi:MAG: prolyl oligopeptidase family serine peptidase [Pseudomonadota bacterium]